MVAEVEEAAEWEGTARVEVAAAAQTPATKSFGRPPDRTERGVGIPARVGRVVPEQEL